MDMLLGKCKLQKLFSLFSVLFIGIASQCVPTTYVFSINECCRVLDSRPRGRGFEPHRCHCVVVLEQGLLIIA